MTNACSNIPVRAVLTLIGCVLVVFALGHGYTFGNMNTYMTSYLRNRSQLSPDVAYADTLWISSSNSIVSSFVTPILCLLEQKIPSRLCILIGGWVSSLAVASTFFSVSHGFPTTVATYGVMYAMGRGLTYAITIRMVLRTFTEKRGIAIGILESSYAGIGFVWNQVVTHFINPDNFSPEHDVNNDRYFSESSVIDRVPYCFLLLGGTYLVLITVGVLLMTDPGSLKNEKESNGDKSLETGENEENAEIFTVEPKFSIESKSGSNDNISVKEQETEETTPDIFTVESTYSVESKGKFNATQEDTNSKRSTDSTKDTEIEEESDFVNGQGPDLSPKEILKTGRFYIIWFMLCTFGYAADVYYVLFKSYGQTFIRDDHFLSLASSFGSGTSVVGSLLWGFLTQKFGYKRTLPIIVGGFGLFLATVDATEYGGKPMVFVWVCMIQAFHTGIFVVTPLIALDMFGSKYYSINYSLVKSAGTFNSLMSALVTSQFKDVVGWHGVFLIAAGMAFVALLLALVIYIKNWSHHQVRKVK